MTYLVNFRFLTASEMSVRMSDTVTTASNPYGAVTAIENRVASKFPDARVVEMTVIDLTETEEDG